MNTSAEPASGGRRILVVDDNVDAAETIAMLLKIKGHQVETRYSGQKGVEAAETLRPEVIIFDISMPVMNGYDACRLVREQEWGKDILIIALTGFGQQEDKRLSQEAGFDSHLVKPVDFAILTDLLNKIPGN